MTLPRSGDTLITDAIVEKASRAAWESLNNRGHRDYALPPWEAADEDTQRNWRADTRAALEAVQGDIIEEFGASGAPAEPEGTDLGDGLGP